MTCTVTPQLLDFLKLWEGVRRKVYADSARKATVGVGHLVLPADNLKLGDVITDEQVNAFLTKDVQVALNAVNTLVRVPLTDNECAALTSFAFNLGTGALKRSKLLTMLNGGAAKTAVAAEFLKFVNAGGRRVLGLVNRRKAECALFLTEQDQ